MTLPLLQSLQLTGISGPDGAEAVGVPLLPPAPDVRLWVDIVGDDVVYSVADPWNSGAEPSLIDWNGALDAFIKIEDAASLLRFARRFGVLSMCPHGQVGHGCVGTSLRQLLGPCQPRQCALRLAERTRGRSWMRCDRRRAGGCWAEYVCREPISGWYLHAKLARAILGVTAALHRDTRPDEVHWSFLAGNFGVGGHANAGNSNADVPPFATSVARRLVAAATDWWITRASLRPIVSWESDVASVEFGGGAYAVLASQILRVVLRGQPLAICSGCGAPYARERAARADRANYCGVCGPKVGTKIRQRRHRARTKREAGNEQEG